MHKSKSKCALLVEFVVVRMVRLEHHHLDKEEEAPHKQVEGPQVLLGLVVETREPQVLLDKEEMEVPIPVTIILPVEEAEEVTTAVVEAVVIALTYRRLEEVVEEEDLH